MDPECAHPTSRALTRVKAAPPKSAYRPLMPPTPTYGPSTPEPVASTATEAGATRVTVVYGSTSGRTEELAERIAARLSARLGASVPVRDVAVADLACLVEPELVILGVPTWNVGELQADWDAVLDDVARLDLHGAHVALFGAGDATCYPDTFGDALGIVAETVEAAGAKVVGHVPVDGYVFKASRAVRDGRLVGLLVDDSDDEDAVRERIERWCDALFALAPFGRTASVPSTEPGPCVVLGVRSLADRS